jgi:hypothetical protein
MAMHRGKFWRADEIIEPARTKAGARQQISLKMDKTQWRTELTGA